jgi:glyoxylase-like metal-dependent hydrolase (beta-lactamase superfamily II)
MMLARILPAVPGLLAGSLVLAHDGHEPRTIEHYSAERVSPNIYVVHSPRGLPSKGNHAFINNPAFVIAKTGVIVVDPGGSLQVGSELVKKIQSVTDKPVIAIITTHIHGDHWLGNDGVHRAFPQAVIYAHPKMVERMKLGEGERWLNRFEQMTEGAIVGTRIVAPTVGVGNGETLNLGGLDIRFHHFKAHTETDIMVEVIGDEALFLGDIVTTRSIPSRNQPQDAHYKGQLDATRTATRLPVKLYIPGHGPTGNRSFVLDSLRLQELLFGAVIKYYRQGLSDFEMKEPIMRELSGYEDWHGFEVLGQIISRIYLEIEADFF